MNLDKLFGVAAAIVTVAAITTVVMRPNSANVIRAIGDSFAGSLKAAIGPK